MSRRRCVRDFIMKRFPMALERKLSDDDSLLGSGVIDSLGILDVVTFLEQDFGCTIEDDELPPDNFDTISSLVRLVEGKAVASSPEQGS